MQNYHRFDFKPGEPGFSFGCGDFQIAIKFGGLESATPG